MFKLVRLIVCNKNDDRVRLNDKRGQYLLYDEFINHLFDKRIIKKLFYTNLTNEKYIIYDNTFEYRFFGKFSIQRNKCGKSNKSD